MYIISTIVITSLTLNITLISSLKYWDLQFNWPIASPIIPIIKKNHDTKVFMFGRYYYSIPMYLNMDIPTVSNWSKIKYSQLSDNWQREIYEGLKYYKKELPDTLMDYQQFSRKWDQYNSIVVIVSDNNMLKFKQLIPEKDFNVISRIKKRNVTIVVKK